MKLVLKAVIVGFSGAWDYHAITYSKLEEMVFRCLNHNWWLNNGADYNNTLNIQPTQL